MEILAFKQPYWRWVFLLIFSLFISCCFSDPRISEAGLLCGVRPQNATNVVPTFTRVMQGLSDGVNSSHFASFQLNSTPPMYGLAQCHGDLSQTDCLQCYAVSRTRIPRCLPSPARIFLDGCFLRYDNYSFLQESVSMFDNVSCSSNNVTGPAEGLFGRNVGYAIGNVTQIALRNGGFGMVQVAGVYALAQCWKSVPVDGCRQCLQKAAQGVSGCVPKAEGRGMNAGCYLRYSTQKFYNEGGETEPDHGKLCHFPKPGQEKKNKKKPHTHLQST